MDPKIVGMADDDDDLGETFQQKQRRKRRVFQRRVDEWIHPTCNMDVDLANQLAKKMGRDAYATYIDALNVQVKERTPDPVYLTPQAVQQRVAAGKMLVEVAVSAQYGSKWEGQVIFPTRGDATACIKACEDLSSLQLSGYVVSYNGRLLQPTNILYDLGIRDGYKIVLLPIVKGMNGRPNWSVRQSEPVAPVMESRHKKLAVTDKTQNELKELLGKNYAVYENLGMSLHDPMEFVDKESADYKKRNPVVAPRDNIYKHVHEEQPQAKYQGKELAPLCSWTNDKAKMARAGRPLQKYEKSMAVSMKKTLMGQKDPAVPAVSSFKEWFSTYGQSDNFFKTDSGKDQTGGKDTLYGYCDKKALGVMSKFEKSRKMVGSEKSLSVGFRKGNIAK